MRIIKEINTYLYNKNTNTKIMHISDIHYSGACDSKRLDFLYKKLSNYEVDYICITGDLIDSNNVIYDAFNKSLLINWLKKISSNRKVLISLGNHDLFKRVGSSVEKCYNKTFWSEINNINNIYLLDNTYYEDDKVFAVGYTQSFDYYYKYKKEDVNIMYNELRCLNIKLNNNKLKVLLMHSPICFKDEKIYNKLKEYDLILSGHMHNGMVLPIIDEIFDNNVGLISPSKKLFPPLARGNVHNDNILIISPGILKLHITVTPLIRWLNIFFPVPINIINVGKYKYSKTYNYHK